MQGLLRSPPLGRVCSFFTYYNHVYKHDTSWGCPWPATGSSLRPSSLLIDHWSKSSQSVVVRVRFLRDILALPRLLVASIVIPTALLLLIASPVFICCCLFLALPATLLLLL